MSEIEEMQSDENNKLKVQSESNKINSVFDAAVDELLSDRSKIKVFVYNLLDEYTTLKNEVDNIQITLSDESLTEEQKKFLFLKIKANNKRMEILLDSIPPMLSILTDIPKKYIDIFSKKQELMNTDTITIQGMMSREKLYE